jgi:hypothetical protein
MAADMKNTKAHCFNTHAIVYLDVIYTSNPKSPCTLPQSMQNELKTTKSTNFEIF